MEKIITIAICIIAFFALLGYIFSDKDEDRVEMQRLEEYQLLCI